MVGRYPDLQLGAVAARGHHQPAAVEDQVVRGQPRRVGALQGVEAESGGRGRVGGAHPEDRVVAQPFLTSAIIGATTMAQLKTNLAAKDMTLSQEVLDAIEEIHGVYTYPCP